ncbi:MAG: HAMP domain-containing protein [Actinobacteria bacterium]|nr:MAG: HAMP domain-containing protein [Actinomycetota bacterium]
MPLHRYQDVEGDGRRRGGPHAAEDQREVADRRLRGSPRHAQPVGHGAMAQPETVSAPPAPPRRAARMRVDNRLVKLVARAPATLRTKLLVGLLAIAALLVLVGVLGLQVLGKTNARVVGLGTLQLRSSTYQALEAHATDLRQALGARSAGTIEVTPYTGGARLQGGRQWTLADLAVADVLSEIELGANEVTFGFVPPPADERVLRRIRRDYRIVYRDLASIKKLDSKDISGYGSEKFIRRAISDLQQSATNLADRTSSEAAGLIAANRSAYTSSRNLFIAVSAGSVAFALVLGVILSWSVIRPIRDTEARLAGIAEGDFTGRLDVPNRDELGALAANVNRMSDELRRLYGDLEAASRHKSEFLANMSHELRTPLNAVIGFSEILHEEMFGELNERQLEYVEDVLDAARHLVSLINDVLDLSKVEAGHMELELTDVSLSEILKSGLTMHEERASRGALTLGLEVLPEEIVLRADERKLRQVVFNLLSNAVKFTSRSPTRDQASTTTSRNRSSRCSSKDGEERSPFVRKEAGSGCRWLGGSSSCTAGGSGSRARGDKERRSGSRCP